MSEYADQLESVNMRLSELEKVENKMLRNLQNSVNEHKHL